MSNGIELMGTQKEMSIIPAGEIGHDFVQKVLCGMVLEVWGGFLEVWGGARRKDTGKGRQCKQR